MAQVVLTLSALLPSSLALAIGGRDISGSIGTRTSLLVALSLGICIFYAFYQVILYPKLLSPLRKLPSPKGGSIWNGHAKKLFSEPNGWPSAEWMLTIPNNGLLRYLGLFNRERVLVTSAKGLAEVSNRTYDFPKPKYIQQLAGTILGPGLVLVDGDEHRRQRKMLSPAFTSKNVKELYPLFWRKSIQLVDLIAKEAKAKSKPSTSIATTTIEISDYASRAALDVITLAALGKDWNSIDHPDTLLSQTYHSIFKLGKFATMMALLKAFVPEKIVQALPIAKNNAVQDAAKIIKDTCRESVQEKSSRLAKDELADVDLLSVLLRSTEIKEEEAVHQMMTFLAAGHETLATAVTWSIYMLCVYPEWQEKLRTEVRNNLPGPPAETEITNQDIDNLVKVNAFCNETLRWWPPIPSTLRTTARDTTLLSHHIPRSTRLVIPIRGANRNPELWGDEAGKFKPERWVRDDGSLDASGGSNTKYGMLTFMHGIRNCIGQSFAKGEMACIVATLIGRFEFSLHNPAEADEKTLSITSGGVTARPTKGLWVDVKEVEGW